MLNWLIEQVNWIIGTVNTVYNWIVSFIQNPYATLKGLFDWTYSRAVQFIEAVKLEIANWTWGLFQGVSAWISWFGNLYNTVIAPAIANIQNLTNGIIAYVSSAISQVVNQALGWVGEQLNNIIRFANDIWTFVLSKTSEITNWTYSLFMGLLADINWLKANIAPFNPADIWRKLEELYHFIAHVDSLIIKIVLDSFLDWLEEKLGEALE